MKTAVFIERDGILFLPGIAPSQKPAPRPVQAGAINDAALVPLRELKAAGLLLIVTTNQPGLSSGAQSRRELELVHNRLRRTFPLDDILVCPHDPDDHCPCRKPRPGLFTEAAFKWHINLSQSFVISDRWQDAEAARICGCISLLLDAPSNGSGHHDFVLPTLTDIADKILNLRNPATARQYAISFR